MSSRCVEVEKKGFIAVVYSVHVVLQLNPNRTSNVGDNDDILSIRTVIS